MSSRGKIEMPVGVVVVPETMRGPDGRVNAVSQYKRADDAALFVSQYTITLSSIWSRLSAVVGSPSWSVHAQYFSVIHAHWPTGESTSPYPRVCGRVDCSAA